MKLSFSLSSSKSSSSSRPLARTGHAGEIGAAAASKKVEFVTEFDPNSTLSADSSTAPKIAPLPNTDSWRAPKRMKNLDPEPAGSTVAERFELDSTRPDSGDVTYGLILRKGNHVGNLDSAVHSNSDFEIRANSDSNLGVNSDSNLGDRVNSDLNLGVRVDSDSNLGVRVNFELSAEQKLKEDMEKLPEDRGFEEFEDIAVEDFSKALLAGYGWKEGQGIGRNAKEDTKIREYKRWAGNGGLGFKSDVPMEKKRKKGGEELPPIGNGASKEAKSKIVRIISGDFAGEEAEIVQSLGNQVTLILSRSRTKVTVAEEFTADLGSAKEEKFLRNMDREGRRKVQVKNSDEFESGKRKRRSDEERKKGLEEVKSKTVRIISGDFAGEKAEIIESLGNQSAGEVTLKLLRSRTKVTVAEELIAELGSSKEEKFLRKMDRSRSKDQAKKIDEFDDGNRKRGPVSWLRSQIRVRIISKEFKKRRLYLKKGTIVDVVGPMTCDISMDESGELLQGVDQEILETALPKRGGSVLVLFGRHKGCYGTLMEKDSEKETAIVRDADNHELIKVRLEEISEYVGDPSVLGY